MVYGEQSVLYAVWGDADDAPGDAWGHGAPGVPFPDEDVRVPLRRGGDPPDRAKFRP